MAIKIATEENETPRHEEVEETTTPAPQRFNKSHRIMLLFVIAVQVGMLGYDFALSRKERLPAAMTNNKPSPSELRLLNEETYSVNNGKGNIRDRTSKSKRKERELMPEDKSTKAPTMKSTKEPTMKSTKAPSLKSTKAPSLKSTKAPTLKSAKGEEPSASAFPSTAPTVAPTGSGVATILDFDGEIDI